MNKSLEVTINDLPGTLYIGLSGIFQEDDLYQIEGPLRIVESAGHNKYVFDFSFLEEIPSLASAIIVLMQMEARKKGRVFTLAPMNDLKTVLLKAGAIRDSEIMANTSLPNAAFDIRQS